MNTFILKNRLFHFVSCIIALVTGIFLGYTFYYCSPWLPRTHKAIAVIHPLLHNTVTGYVTFEQEKDGIRVVLECYNLTPGEHGFHIHTYGDARCPDSFCNHFNPKNKKHGGLTSHERHIGDFGNITANASGVARAEFVDTELSLNGPESILGRAVIIHANRDDLTSQPSGNSGERIGYGVIGIANPNESCHT